MPICAGSRNWRHKGDEDESENRRIGEGGKVSVSPNGAALIGSLGQRPRMDEEKRTSAESAIHSGIESRLQPSLTFGSKILGCCPRLI